MRRKLLIALAALATAVATAIPAGAGPLDSTAAAVNSSRAPYLVVMESQPVLGNEETAVERGQPLDASDPAVERYVEEIQEEKAEAVENAGIDADAVVASFQYASNGFSALLTEAEAEALAQQKGVRSVVQDELHQLHTDNSPSFLGIDKKNGAWAAGIDGEGVVVGVIDTGIWPEHPSFADDGTYPAPPITLDTVDLGAGLGIPFVSTGCDFGNTAYNPADAPFRCNNKLIGARNAMVLYDTLIPGETYHSARDYDGHGTHVASTAAGNAGVNAELFGRDFGTVSGIAHRAHVVMYSACGDLGCFGGDLTVAIDQAVADGVDVINYSIGSGTPGLTGPDDIAFLFAADAGVFVATSNGNGGPGASTTGSPASVPWITSVGASTQDRTFEAKIKTGHADDSRWTSFWAGSTGRFKGASVTPGTGGQKPFVDAADHGNELCDPAVSFDPSISGKVVLCLRGGFARVAKSQAVYEQGGAGMVLYNPTDTQALVTDNHWVPSAHINLTDGTALKDYIDEAGSDATVQIQGSKRSDAQGRVMADFSSRGPVGAPASADIIKPDVTAPGVNILAGNTPTPTLGSPGELFQSISGTSMSSPHVAGVFALIKQANPDWSPAMAKSAIMTTATQSVRKEDGITKADPFDRGAGHIKPRGNPDRQNSIFDPGLVYDAGLFEYAAFTCGLDLGVFTPGSCVFLDGLGIPFEPYNLNLPSIGVSEVPGVRTVERTVTNVSSGRQSYTAHVKEPAGYDITVTPSTLNLAPGESATFVMTITNVSAPVDVWRFGSLKWKAGTYKVKSPIAVKGSLLEAPSSITGTGADGSASFDVNFGYTGDYTAAPHGLVPDTPASGSVGQDPDQTFDPSDVGNGATAHPFTLTGSAFLRITMDQDDVIADPATDIDLFLYYDGAEIANSTAGGTAELIDIALPADGDYILYVHGWSVPDAPPDVDYTAHMWDVPLASGGSLSVDSAPASAVLGTSGTVGVSWTGLGAGHYLGAVSHSDGSGLLGLTLVDIAN